MKKLIAVLITAALLTGVPFIRLPAKAAEDTNAFDTNYGFVAMNESSRITLQEESVWLTAKAATKGDIFDYVYKKAIDPNDFEINYTVVNDTTRDNGTHSRLNLYILPSAGAAPGDGVLIQLIQFALGADNDEIKHTLIVGSGPDGGWSNYAHFNADYSVNLKLYSKDGVFRLSVNGTEYSFSGANANLLKSFAANGGAYLRLSARFQENGESAYGGDYAVASIKDAAGTVSFGSKYGTQEDRSSDIGTSSLDKYEGVYGDDITGKLEFSRFDYNNLTPNGSILAYSVTEEGLAIFGRNDDNGFAAGLSGQNPLTIDHDHELSFTLVMPEEVYSTNSGKNAEYSVFVCESANVNFSETRSLYLRFTYRYNDYKVSGANAVLLEVIMWDNQDANLVVASNTANIAPKSEAEAAREFTFRIVFDAEAKCYKLYVNGQRASTSATEQSITNYFDNVMAAKFLSSTVSYTNADRSHGGWSDDDEGLIGFTLRSVNGQKIVNEAADVMEVLELTADTVTKDSAELFWTEAEMDETDFDAMLGLPDGYIVKRQKAIPAEDGTLTLTDDGEFYVDGVENTNYDDKDLKPDTRYFYTVFAVKNNGDGTYTDLLCSYSLRVVTPAEEGAGTATDAPVSTPAGTNAAENTPDGSGESVTTPGSGEKNDNKKNGALVPIIIGAAVLAAAAAAVIIVLVNKKKKG
ncbi:MAG: fibronectin type III domain-containing protein [Clostridia bacterium]|nr:fibronectin type III domain-containing protein [Clostridia bacterium]